MFEYDTETAFVDEDGVVEVYEDDRETAEMDALDLDRAAEMDEEWGGMTEDGYLDAAYEDRTCGWEE